MSIILKEGFMTMEELADWSQISVRHLSKNKKTWCAKHLSKYADFEMVRGGVIINKVHCELFASSGKKEVEEKYYDHWGSKDFKVDSNKVCWEKIKPTMRHPLTDSTGCTYVSKARCIDYGPAPKAKQREGRRGTCHFVYCKLVNNVPQPFTKEEEEIRKDLARKYLSNRENDVYEMQALLWAYQSGDIDKEEYFEIMLEMTSRDKGWIEFQTAFESAIGCPTDFRIEIVDNAIKLQELKSQAFDF